ncbi:MAG TPA: regulatory protein GemA [Acidiferrobacteraceae bacterium]|nr:regulatory protein GemA [Acidiferrobacteraceae bacterium]
MTAARKHSPQNRLYTLLAVGKKDLGWDEDTYRDFLADHGASLKGDKYSATTMSVSQLEVALHDMKKLGFKPRRKNKPVHISDWRKPRIAMLNGIWITMADAGVVHDRSEAALTKFCFKFTQVANLSWASSIGLNQAIEALKSWAHREGVKLRGKRNR